MGAGSGCTVDSEKKGVLQGRVGRVGLCQNSLEEEWGLLVAVGPWNPHLEVPIGRFLWVAEARPYSSSRA